MKIGYFFLKTTNLFKKHYDVVEKRELREILLYNLITKKKWKEAKTTAQNKSKFNQKKLDFH